jgi:IclR family acetate operon transcriptional repressor
MAAATTPTHGSLERALDLLELLADHGELGASEIERLLDTSKPTTFRLLAKLNARGFVEQSAGSRRHRLGPAFRALAARSEVPAVIRMAAPVMGELLTSTGETVNLATVRRGRLVYAAVVDSPHPLRMSSVVGDEIPPHATALGKAVLAGLAPTLRVAFLGTGPLAALTERTITVRRDLAAELDVVHQRGYAIDDEESADGAVCVGAAIRGGDGDPIAALSISGPLARIPRQSHAALGLLIKERCDAISADLALPSESPHTPC